MYFLTFLDLETVDTKALFTLLQPPLEGSGEVVFGEGTDDPLPRVLDSYWALGMTASFLFRISTRKKSAGAKSGQEGGLGMIWVDFLARNSWTLWAFWTGNLGAHLADFVTRLRSLCRMLNMVPYEV